MIRAGLALIFGLWATIAAGETVQVVTGEHSGFSRIVLRLDSPSGWVLGRVAGGYGLRLARSGVAFDLSRAFDLIPRNRLRDLEAEGGILILRTDCVCYADPFELRPGVLVIDLKDGGPEDGSRFEAMLDPMQPVPRVLVPLSQTEAGRLSTYWRADEHIAPPIVEPMGAPNSVSRAAEQALVSAVPDPRIAEARTELLRQIGRAASQGLMQITPPKLAPALREPVSQERTTPVPAPPEPPNSIALPEQAPARSQIAVHAETSIDRDSLADWTLTPTTAEGETCLPDVLFDIASWGDDRGPALQLADRRQALIGEFDRPAPEAVAALVRFYLFLGFGAEAREALTGFGVSVPEADLLRSMATIMDQGVAEVPGRLAGMEDCDTAAALWAALAHDQIGRGDPLNKNAVIRSFSALPLGLRRLLGPLLAGRFLEIGDDGTARMIRDAISRAGGPSGPLVRLVDAQLDLGRDETAAAEAELLGIIAEDGSGAPEAVLLYLKTRMARGERVDPKAVETAAALAFEHRGTAMGAQLARAHVLGLAAAGDFGAAFAMVHSLTNLRAGAAPAPLDPDLFGLLRANADDTTFLRIMFGSSTVLRSAELPRDLRQALAERLLDLGFAPQAREVLAAAPGSGDPKDRLVLGRAALIGRDAAGALAEIAGMMGPKPARLRAEALTQLGHHGAAATAFLQADMPDKQAIAAWQAGDLAAVRRLGDESQQAKLAHLIDQEQTPITGKISGNLAAASSGPLALDRALLERSTETRRSLDALLAVFPGLGAAVP